MHIIHTCASSIFKGQALQLVQSGSAGWLSWQVTNKEKSTKSKRLWKICSDQRKHLNIYPRLCGAVDRIEGRDATEVTTANLESSSGSGGLCKALTMWRSSSLRIQHECEYNLNVKKKKKRILILIHNASIELSSCCFPTKLLFVYIWKLWLKYPRWTKAKWSIYIVGVTDTVWWRMLKLEREFPRKSCGFFLFLALNYTEDDRCCKGRRNRIINKTYSQEK